MRKKGNNSMSEKSTHSEEFQVNGEDLIARIKELVRQGNIRRISVRNEEGRTLVDLPLTWGVVGALVAPQLAALGAVAALLTKASIIVERADDEKGEEAPQ
jgi:Domain of unknown function (DUF4342)